MEKEIELFNHQVKAINAVSGKENVGFFLEMGLGKSITGICQCLIFDNPRTLLVCPKSLILTWKNTFSQFFPELKVTDLTKCKNVLDFIGFGIINYDILFRRKELLDLTDYTLMLDESSKIMHDTSKRTKFILKMKPKNKFNEWRSRNSNGESRPGIMDRIRNDSFVQGFTQSFRDAREIRRTETARLEEARRVENMSDEAKETHSIREILTGKNKESSPKINLYPGDTIGEYELISRKFRISTALASEDTELPDIGGDNTGFFGESEEDDDQNYSSEDDDENKHKKHHKHSKNRRIRKIKNKSIV